MRYLRPLFAVLLVVAAATYVEPGIAQAALPSGFRTTLVAGSTLDAPSGLGIAPDGRLFVLERAGRIKIVKNGQLLAQPFAELPSAATGDRGLIGVAFHPQFGVANHYVYFYYTGLDLLNRVVRFDASTDIGTAGPLTIYQTTSPSQQLHVGGSLAFGPDGKLYLAVGDNGYPPNAQNLANPHGKILRINSDGTIPADNPFAGQAGKDPAIWAYGMRNPWRFQFDSATGRLYGGDVGDYSWEELNLIVKGANYGWPLAEGRCTTDCTGLTDPRYTYAHDGQSAAVTGGPVYRGTMFPIGYQGKLFFADYAKGFIRTAQLDGNGNITAVQDFDPSAGTVVDLKVASDGSLYYLNYYPGELYRVTYQSASHEPTAQAAADVTKGVTPLRVQFSSAGSSDPDGDPLTYRWDFGDGTTSTERNPRKTYRNSGVYQARLTVSDGIYQSTARPIVIQVGIPPTVTIGAPAPETSYRAGDTITYNAFATDAAGLDLNDAAISTEIRFHHGTHFHPFAGPMTGRVGSFTIPTTGEAAADTWYEIIVTGTDSNGLSTTKSVAVRPRLATLTLATSPPGLTLGLDGVPVTAPLSFQGVSGFERELSAPVTAIAADGTAYHFTGWSDRLGIRHVITTPDSNTIYTANYSPSPPFTAQYFANATPTGAPVLTRQEPRIDHVWALDAPAPAVPADNFSARWTKTQFFAAGRYRFTTVTDDGLRLYIDNQLVIDQWHDQSAIAHEYVGELAAGNHTIVMEYFDSGWDAVAQLNWQTTADQPELYLAEYWNTPDIGSAPPMPTTTPTASVLESKVDHEWFLSAPADGVNPDHFAARWTKTTTLPTGRYEFTVTADDGVRLVVDGQRVIDQWHDQGATTYTTQITLAQGRHTIVMEYYENAWDATARLQYQLTS